MINKYKGKLNKKQGVVFCWIFGTMINLPKNFPMYCKDIKQLADEMGNPKIETPEEEHNALADAEWNEKYYYYLSEKK